MCSSENVFQYNINNYSVVSTLTSMNQKRKRTKNSSKEQLELYLQYMENDYHFRSGTINPTLGENYLQKVSTKLCNSLNAIGDGPTLEVEEWKKRFNDWKYATRYRKLSQHRLQTGSGAASDIKMSDSEERGLAVWGKVVVTGMKCTEYEGVELQSALQVSLPEVDDIEDDTNLNDTLNQTASVIHLNETALNETHDEVNYNAVEIETVAEVSEERRQGFKEKLQKRKRQKPLSTIAEKLIEVTESQSRQNAQIVDLLNGFCQKYIYVKIEENAINKRKLQFCMEKYKYEHPNFQFNDQ